MYKILKQSIEKTFDFSLNSNQSNDIIRLFHEIKEKDNTSFENIIKDLKKDKAIQRTHNKAKFQAIKQALIKMRFPVASSLEKVNPNQVFLSQLKPPLKNTVSKSKEFIPEKIFIEKKAKNSYLALKFKEKFPKTPITYLNHLWEYAQKNKFKLKDLKKPYVFIVKENWDFIKMCPCTKNHIGCNYWIFNLGFGCPYDCSYCFLQQYANFPGIILPSNLDDFFDKFDDFYKKIKKPIRIGTGEFCDSLALDYITEYSKQLIEFFKQKNVFFELKTKSSNIKNILSIKGASNIVISWSLNPKELIRSQECKVASLEKRLESAKKVQEKGYSLSFHFDPVIYSEDWEKLYKNLIKKLYNSDLKKPFKWISIGTLRGTRKLKSASELRFPKNNIFYSELLLGKDKKLRYPKLLRKKIYEKMIKWIRSFDKKTPVYLCMEDNQCWESMDRKLANSKEVEKYLIKTN